jgi:prepilin-type processing-associated H-X9-DG protein
MTNRRSGGFGLTELFVVLILIGFCATFTLAVANRAREVDYRIACLKNLKTIGTAIFLYSADNKGNYPRTRFDPDAGKWNAYTAWQAPDPFNADKGAQPPEVNDVTAALFLLVRTQQVAPETFVCPSSTTAYPWDFARALAKDKAAAAGVTTQDRANFPSPAFLSYSYRNPYPDAAAIRSGYKVNNTVDALIPIAADMNPGGKALAALTADAPAEKLRDGNSLNHDRAGQNVLYGDGHVEFV